MKTLSIDNYEQGILIHALNDMRNELISEERPTDAVDDLLLKAMDAKESGKCRLWRKRGWKERCHGEREN